MPHPIQFDDADPWLGRLREVALAYPRAEEVVSHGRPTFRVGKIFCLFGSEERLGDGSRLRHPAAVVVKAEPSELAALDEDGRFFLPRYWASSGWRGIDLDTGAVDLDEVAELVDASYRLVAPKRALAELDARG